MPGGQTDLDVSPGRLHVLLVGGVPGLRPVAADGDGDEAALLGAVHVVVQVPGLGVGLDQVVAGDVRGGAGPEGDAWTHTWMSARRGCSPECHSARISTTCLGGNGT